MEMIRIRAGESGAGLLKEFAVPVSKLKQRGLAEIRIYRHAALESDVSIHLYWETVDFKPNGSTVGLHLVRSLGDFGLIDHTTWIQETGANHASKDLNQDSL